MKCRRCKETLVSKRSRRISKSVKHGLKKKGFSPIQRTKYTCPKCSRRKVRRD